METVKPALTTTTNFILPLLPVGVFIHLDWKSTDLVVSISTKELSYFRIAVQKERVVLLTAQDVNINDFLLGWAVTLVVLVSLCTWVDACFLLHGDPESSASCSQDGLFRVTVVISGKRHCCWDSDSFRTMCPTCQVLYLSIMVERRQISLKGGMSYQNNLDG